MKQVTSKDGTTIAYDQKGEGPPLILVDGALCSRAFGTMPKLAELLAPHFTVINYDRRGRNESGDKQPYSAEGEIDDIEALISEAGGSAYVLCISSGATLALKGVASGLNITKLVVYEPPFMVDEEGHHPPDDSEAQLRALIAEGRRGDAVKFFMRDMAGVPKFIVFIMSILPIFSKLKTVAHTLPYDAAVMGDWSIPAGLASNIKIPTLIGGGDKSPVTLRHAVKQLAEIIPHNTFKIFKGQDHNINAKVLAPAVIEFLTQ